ncbi:hypothetical protein GE061_019758 [Apolygus lucorum]|uniref:Uncharacterized protein n=1 Tax=Apolygus lucorum TaxID=248454 RepID=A0A6A4J912_APOLU|nr:hypothetical protein GE061_019758 [Apolygus lucorum]
MAGKEETALIVVGLLLVLAHSCAAQATSDLRTYGLQGGLLPSSASFQNSYDPTGFNRGYQPNAYSGNYFNNYASSGVYARQQVPSGVPGCQSGLVNSGQASSTGNDPSVQASNSVQEKQKDGPTRASNEMPSDPKAAQTFATQSSNVQQSIVQEALPIQQIRPMPYMPVNSYHNPYVMRSFNQPMLVPAQPFYADQQHYDNMRSTRVVPPQLHYFDPSGYSARQNIIPQRPAMELTYNPEDMTKVYGSGNFQPPIFSLWKRQSPAGYRGLQGYQFNYPPVDYRILSGGLQQQYQQQRLFEHPLQKLRQTGPLDHANQPLPPNVYRSGKWEPMTNLQIENPVNLAQFEQSGYDFQGPAGYSMQGARDSSSTTLCREKRQVNPTWMYQLADWVNSPLSQQRESPTLPESAPPLTPYHGPYAPLSQIFPSGQSQDGLSGQMYPLGFTTPHARGAVEGIQHFVSGITQMVPMFASGGY